MKAVFGGLLLLALTYTCGLDGVFWALTTADAKLKAAYAHADAKYPLRTIYSDSDPEPAPSVAPPKRRYYSRFARRARPGFSAADNQTDTPIVRQ